MAIKIDSSETGGAHSIKSPGPIKEKYGDDVGSDAGSNPPGGSNVAADTIDGGQSRESNYFNPQGTKDGIVSEYTSKVSYGGKTDYSKQEA